MVILSIIIGVFLMIGGFSCMMSPAQPFFETGYFIAILMLVYGVAGIVRVIGRRASAVELVMHIPAVIIGLISIFKPGTTLIIDAMMIYCVAVWFIIQGAVSIYVSLVARGVKKGWILGLILGILGVILGIYSLFHPMVPALTIGFLIGFYFIEAGLDMIVLATAVGSVKK